ncbi:hypothetical protein ACO0E1_13525 [Curtobacterium sp. RRHDQ66]
MGMVGVAKSMLIAAWSTFITNGSLENTANVDPGDAVEVNALRPQPA